MLRDARINQIGEGANEVLTSFIALVGMRAPGERFREILRALQHPWGGLRKAWMLGLDRLGATLRTPEVPVGSPSLQPHARRLGEMIRRFNVEVDRALIRHREEILERQYVQERIARAAMELFACACVLSRRDAELQASAPGAAPHAAPPSAAELFLRGSYRRTRRSLAEMHENDDAVTSGVADWVLRRGGGLH